MGCDDAVSVDSDAVVDDDGYDDDGGGDGCMVQLRSRPPI